MKKLSNNKEIIFNLYLEVTNEITNDNMPYIYGIRAKTYIVKRNESDTIKLSMLQANCIADIKDSKKYDMPPYCTTGVLVQTDNENIGEDIGTIRSIPLAMYNLVQTDNENIGEYIGTIRAIPLALYNSDPQKYLKYLFDNMYIQIEKEYCTKIDSPLFCCTVIKKDEFDNWVAKIDNVVNL